MIPKQDLVIIKNFCNSCDDMVNGKFILVDVKISKVLKCVAGCQTLYQLMENSLKGFDLAAEFSKATVGSPVRKTIKLPDSNKKLIALALGLLLEVDKKNIDLHTFLHEFYHSIDGSSSEYTNFSKSMILPFKLAVLHELELAEDFEPGTYIADHAEEDKAQTEQAKIEEKEYIDTDKKYEAIKDIIKNIKDRAAQEFKVKPEKLEDLYLVLDAMTEGANYQSAQIISGLWLAYIQEVKAFKSLKQSSDGLLNAISQLYA